MKNNNLIKEFEEDKWRKFLDKCILNLNEKEMKFVVNQLRISFEDGRTLGWREGYFDKE